jgi:hypothetical protein
VVRGVVVATNITHKSRVVDVGKMIKPQYEATLNLFLFATFVTFVAILYHPTIGKGKNK